MKSFFLRWWHVLGVSTIYIQGLIYLWIGRNAGAIETVHYNYYWIDLKIPFLSWFVFPYMSWMPVMYLAFIYFAIVDRKIYWRVLAAYNIAVMGCNVIFLLFATYVPRPDIEPSNLALTLVQFIYNNDAPLNCFPSVHCLTSYLLFITINRDLKLGNVSRIAWSVLMWLIIASTVFIKQHSLLDVVGGILVAEVTYQLVRMAANRFYVRKKQYVGSKAM